MEGFDHDEELRGIIPRSVQEIFSCPSTHLRASAYLFLCSGCVAHVPHAHSNFLSCCFLFCCADIQNTAHTNVRFLVRASYIQIYSR